VRVNVALTRAKCLVVVVADPRIGSAAAGSIGEMMLINLFVSWSVHSSEIGCLHADARNPTGMSLRSSASQQRNGPGRYIRMAARKNQILSFPESVCVNSDALAIASTLATMC